MSERAKLVLIGVIGVVLAVAVAIVLLGGDDGSDAPEVVSKQGNLDAPGQVLESGQEASVVMETSEGSFTIELDTDAAPKTTNSFAYLTEQGFYDGLGFHRIVPDFVVQGGDPLGDGTGDPGFKTVEKPPADLSYEPGVVAMARAGDESPGTSGSQFFVVTGSGGAALPPEYALVGRVSEGFDVVEEIGSLGGPDEQPTRTVVIEKATLEEGLSEMPVEALEPVAFEIAGTAPALRGESSGEGPDLILCHGLSATRRYVVHGSKVLPRKGYRLHTYDARGHGESDPAGDGYGYGRLADDLGRVAGSVAQVPQPVLGGHSMGCHTAVTFALREPERVSALILVGPVYTPELDGEDELARWDERAQALETGGPEAFGRAAAEGIESPAYRETIERLARDRAALHRHPDAVAQALREVPRSRPFTAMEELDRLEMPVLVAGTRDEADPGHPEAVARLYAQQLPNSEFVIEKAGESPLSWQGGRLSREIAGFLGRNGIDGLTGQTATAE